MWRPGSGCPAACSGGAGVGAGEAGEGDFEAEGAELADVVGDLAADVALVLVVPGAEVFIPRAGVRQQSVAGLQLGVAQGDLGFGLAAAAGQPPVAGALAGLGFPGRDGGLAGDRGQVPVALLGLGFPLRLPDWLSSGVRPAQEARWAPVGNRLMSGPVSARVSWAERRPHPGIDSAWASCSS
jgi:hypothetical protein